MSYLGLIFAFGSCLWFFSSIRFYISAYRSDSRNLETSWARIIVPASFYLAYSFYYLYYSSLLAWAVWEPVIFFSSFAYKRLASSFLLFFTILILFWYSLRFAADGYFYCGPWFFPAIDREPPFGLIATLRYNFSMLCDGVPICSRLSDRLDCSVILSCLLSRRSEYSEVTIDSLRV